MLLPTNSAGGRAEGASPLTKPTSGGCGATTIFDKPHAPQDVLFIKNFLIISAQYEYAWQK